MYNQTEYEIAITRTIPLRSGASFIISSSIKELRAHERPTRGSMTRQRVMAENSALFSHFRSIRLFLTIFCDPYVGYPFSPSVHCQLL